LRFIYNFFLYLFLPFVIFRLYFQSLRIPAYRQRIPERFGWPPELSLDRPVIWIHAVSVGEVYVAKPLIDLIRSQYPEFSILVTTMTPTGAQIVEQQLGDSVVHLYVPYDLPGAVKRFIYCIKPVLLLVMETEVWPNLFFYCKKNNISVVIANARLSEKSFKGYKCLSGLTKEILSYVSMIIARSQADADYFIRLGADAANVKVSGNLKFDIELPENLQQQTEALRRESQLDRPVWIAASTHEHEENVILAAFKKIISEYPDCLLIIAPRHPDRAESIASLVTKSGFAVMRKSQNAIVSDNTQVYILDTLGELTLYYAVADLAFVGGSLVPVGGHNVLEPASLGIPVITGPHNHNFQEICELLEKTGALQVVQNTDQLINQVNLLLADADLRHNAGEQGRKIVESNRGSVSKLMYFLQTFLNRNATSGIS
jgi:3-deoxy-D-manno-octulosonic-acid transferase